MTSEKPAPKLLTGTEWQAYYSHEDGNLVDLFFTPALTASCLYQRVTGYFSANVLAMASRGLLELLRNQGRMQLIVGCTLGTAEIEQIDAGYKLRDVLSTTMATQLGLAMDDETLRERIGWLSWMVAKNLLDVKLAVPKDEYGRYVPGLGLYHAKAGILTDSTGNRLVFTGSINETRAAWKHNWESFSVSCSWRGEWDAKRVGMAVEEFARLWNGQAKSAEVVDFPQAAREELFQFLPKDDSFLNPKETDQPACTRTCTSPKTTPEAIKIPVPEDKPALPASEQTATEIVPAPAAGLVAEIIDEPTSEEKRRNVWETILHAPKQPDGALVAVRTSTVEPWPHQLRAYKRMLDNWPVRLLIADEVGLGKTIEAGMIIRHAWISGLARRILIMTPRGILRQWQAELYEKFNLLVPIYTGKNLVWPKHHFPFAPLESKVDRSAWTQTPFVLVSSHLMRRRDRQQELMEAQEWDLLILDEAHHARRRGAGTPQEKGPNLMLRLIQALKDKARSLILLTATPMQVHPIELWDLLKLLGTPEEWLDRDFLDYFEAVNANPDESGIHRLCRLFQSNEAYFGTLSDPDIEQKALELGIGNIDRKNILKALREDKSLIPIKRLTAKLRKALLAYLRFASPVRYRMSRHTRSLLRAYHKKGLLATPIADRLVTDLPITLTPPEREIYEAVENYISTAYQAAAPDKKTAVGFILTVYRRRVASSFYALRKTLENRLARISGHVELIDEIRLNEDLPQDEIADEVISAEEMAELENIEIGAEEKEAINSLLKRIAKLGADSKALRLVEEIRAALAQEYDSAIVFTQYTDTMHFLKDFLADRLKLSIGCFSGSGGLRKDASGSWSSCSKEEIKRLLQTGAFDVLLCTDAAGEGLNLQYCGVLVNYDLPWNPMKVEQRIGRIDRIGQKYANVRIINMAYENTVEADVYFALSERIGLFHGVVGKLQPILSQIPRQFESAVLKPGDRDKSRHEAVTNVRKLVDEQEAAGFDIDVVSEADLRLPDFPEPSFAYEDMNIILKNEALLPPGFTCRELESSTYALSIPGFKEEARVTTSPAVFDQHFESHQLLLPDSPIFRRMVKSSGAIEDTVC
jgi:SNF2 family DNA or RNA helicase